MVNTRLSVAIHILSLIAANPRESSEMIAGSVNTNPVVIRRMISQLKKGGILTSRPGVAGATLKRDPEDISLLDIYRAVQPQEELFAIHDKPNPNCPVEDKFKQRLTKRFTAYSRRWRTNWLASLLKTS